MTEPITTALIVGLAAQKFAEGAAGKAAEKLVERLWDAIVARFKGKSGPKVDAAIGQIESSQGEESAANQLIATVLEGEFVKDEGFEAELKGLAQQIIEINQSQNQTQAQISITVDARDNARVNAVGKLDAKTVNFGDQK